MQPFDPNESARNRIITDTSAAVSESPLKFLLLCVFCAALVAAATFPFIDSDSHSSGARWAMTVATVVFGGLLAAALVLSWMIAKTPYRQRDDARIAFGDSQTENAALRRTLTDFDVIHGAMRTLEGTLVRVETELNGIPMAEGTGAWLREQSDHLADEFLSKIDPARAESFKARTWHGDDLQGVAYSLQERIGFLGQWLQELAKGPATPW